MENAKRTKRTILYYPTISIPTGSWLRQSLLYWDEIASIVPQSSGGRRALIPYSDDIRYLESEEQFRPISPDKLARSETWQLASAFENELLTILHSVRFQKMLLPVDQRNFESRIHRNKITDAMLHYFVEEMQLARLGRRRDGWIHVESNTALLYMALLAKYLALDDSEWTIPGTDRPDYENWIFRATSPRYIVPCLASKIYSVLPVPREDVPLSDIVKFKQRRRSELINFREQMDDFHNDLRRCESASDIKHVVVQFGEKLEKGVHNLISTLQDARVATIWGALKTLVHPTSGTLLAGIGTAIAAKILSVPLTWALPITGSVAAIQVGSYLVDARNKENNIVRDSPFSYVYSASGEGLTMPIGMDEERIEDDETTDIRPVKQAPHKFA